MLHVPQQLEGGPRSVSHGGAVVIGSSCSPPCWPPSSSALGLHLDRLVIGLRHRRAMLVDASWRTADHGGCITSPRSSRRRASRPLHLHRDDLADVVNMTTRTARRRARRPTRGSQASDGTLPQGFSPRRSIRILRRPPSGHSEGGTLCGSASFAVVGSTSSCGPHRRRRRPPVAACTYLRRRQGSASFQSEHDAGDLPEYDELPVLWPRAAEPRRLALDRVGTGQAAADRRVQRLPRGVRSPGRVHLGAAVRQRREVEPPGDEPRASSPD